MKIDPASMVTNIKDATKTKVQFKEEYDFSQEGVIDVVVQVIDEGNAILYALYENLERKQAAQWEIVKAKLNIISNMPKKN